MKRQIISFAVAFLAVAGAWAQNGPRVRVEGGMIEGRDSSGVKVFEGIPFAQPPVGRSSLEGTSAGESVGRCQRDEDLWQ